MNPAVNYFILFKQDVGDDLFQNPEKLHLTIGTLVLLNQSDRDRAADALVAFRDRIP